MALFKQAFCCQFIDHRLHLVFKKRLAIAAAVVLGEMNIQPLINLGKLAPRPLNALLPQPPGFRITILEFFKPSPALVLQRRVFLGFFMKFNIQGHQLFDRVFRLADGCFVAPGFDGINLFAKLRPPVTQVIVTVHRGTGFLQQVGNGIADDGGTQVANRKRLSDVGRRVLNHDFSA